MPLHEIIQIAKESDAYSAAHVLLAIITIHDEMILGRYEIGKQLGLPTNQTRNLLKWLRDKQLINPVKRKGHTLTRKGTMFFNTIQEKIPYHSEIKCPNFVPTPSYLVQIREPLQTTSNGVTERDLAVRNKALGGVTFRKKKTELNLLGVAQDLEKEYPEFNQFVQDNLSIRDGDALFIAFSDSLPSATLAALAVAIWMLCDDSAC